MLESFIKGSSGPTNLYREESIEPSGTEEVRTMDCGSYTRLHQVRPGCTDQGQSLKRR